MTLKLSRKQKRALDLLNDPQVTDLLFGGGAGGGKSVLVCIWMVLQCRDYPGIRIALGRKEMKRLKETTIVERCREPFGLPAGFPDCPGFQRCSSGGNGCLRLSDIMSLFYPCIHDLTSIIFHIRR